MPTLLNPRVESDYGELVILHRELLSQMAAKYIWWMTVDEALNYPARIIAQVMNIGVFDDAFKLFDALGEDVFRACLRDAEPGQFSLRSWHFWHYRLGVVPLSAVPPLPVRHIP